MHMKDNAMKDGHVHLNKRTVYAPGAYTYKLHTQGWDDATVLFTSSDIAPILSSGDNCPALMDQLEGQRLSQHPATGSGSSRKHSYNRSILRF